MTLGEYVFWNIQIAKDVVRQMSKKYRFRTARFTIFSGYCENN